MAETDNNATSEITDVTNEATESKNKINWAQNLLWLGTGLIVGVLVTWSIMSATIASVADDLTQQLNQIQQTESVEAK